MLLKESKALLAILDDNTSFRSAMQDLIEAEGMSALCFSSAEQFWGSEARFTAACLIPDIRMPGMSGLELQVKLNAERCMIPIIFVTAHGDEEMRFQALRAGAVEFLPKPFDDEVLIESVRAALGR